MATPSGVFFSTAEVAKRLRVSQRRVNALIESGLLKAVRLGPNYAIEEEELIDYAKRRRRPKNGGRPKKTE